MANTHRGRARKSIAEKKRDGTYRPDRDSHSYPEAKGTPVKPDYLNEQASALWDWLTPQLVELGVASAVDTQQLSALCEWWAEYRRAADRVINHETSLLEIAKGVNRIADAMLVDTGDCETADRVLRDIGSVLQWVDKKEASRISAMQKAYREFTSIASKFGLTPTDRTALRQVESPEKADPLNEFLKHQERILNSPETG